MNKAEIAAFFDRAAASWDAHMVIDDKKTNRILDAAGIEQGSTVLDVACGTGVLFPYYLEREVSRVIAVDISREMIACARRKLHDPRVELICADVETLPVHRRVDAVMLYNCFPHFPEPARLLEALSCWLRPGGRLTVAHSMGVERLNQHHGGAAAKISRGMLEPDALCRLLEPRFCVDTAYTDSEIYLVSGVLNAK